MATQTVVPQVQAIAANEYRRLPAWRRSGMNSVFLLVHLFTLGFIPLLLVTCIALATGDIYYNQLDADGRLKRWSTANKVIAWVLLAPWILIVGAVAVGLVAGLVREMFS